MVTHNLRKIFFTLLFILLFTHIVSAETINEQSMTILAVSELPNGTLFGGVAKLTLELIPGKGRVFIDTFPLTKVDTQVSTRSAKQIACDFLDNDCSNIDFIYTIKSGSAIIGGPSAGAAMTALTIATLDGEIIKGDVSISGTINPGGIVGSVGGLKQKIQAADEHGIKKVLIPSGEAERKTKITDPIDFTQNVSKNNETNETINLITYGEELRIEVIETSNIYEVLEHITEKKYPYINATIQIPDYYKNTMKQIANQMCERSQNELNSISISDYRINNNTVVSITKDDILFVGNNTVLANSSIDINSTYQTATDLQEYGLSSIEFEQYYAAASYCYGTNLNLHFLTELETPYEELQIRANETIQNNYLNLKNYNTITDLQTYMLVQERIDEAKEQYKIAQELQDQNKTADAKNKLVVTIERINSAKEWSAFANNFGKSYDLNPRLLRESCQLKMQEAEERYNYLLLYAPFATHLRAGIDKAQEYASKGSYELCLHQSSLAKADIDVILGSTGVSKDQLTQTVENRVILVEQVILKQIQKENFPLIGYSYLEYAKALAQNDPQSSLLYLQYAIELSNIDLFFPQEKKNQLSITQNNTTNNINSIKAEWFLVGMIATLVTVGLTHFIFRQNRKK